MIPIRARKEVSLIPQVWTMFPGMVLLTPVLLTCRVILLVHAFTDVASAKILFNTGVIRFYGASTIRFSGEGKVDTFLMVLQLKMFLSKHHCLWVTVFRLLVWSPCVSLAVALFNSYPELFILKLLIASNILSDLSSFSLTNIASDFSLCELDTWMNASSVTLLASVIDSSLSYIMNLTITPQIFALDKGASLLSLKVVMVLLSSI